MNRKQQDGLSVAAIVLFLTVMLTVAITYLWEWAWNMIVPPLFHGPHITFWQAFALSMLVGLITSGLRASTSKS